MKKIISVLATVAIVLSSLVLSAAAVEIVDSGTCGFQGSSDVIWTMDGNGKVVISAKPGSDGLMEQFMSLSGGISPWMLSEKVTSVEIQEGVTGVGMYAFTGCSNLKTVTFPSTLTRVGTGAFADCVKLEKIVLSENVRISSSAFKNCTALTSVTLPYSAGLDNCFEGCNNIREICYLGNEGSWERAGGEKLLATLGDVEISMKPRTASGTCSIDTGADVKWVLNETGELRIYGNGRVGRGANLNMKPIPYGWEKYATEIDRIVVEPGVTSIGDFRALGFVNRIYIPESVTEIKAGCFPNAESQTTVYYAGTEAQWNEIDIDRDPPYYIVLNYGGNYGLDSCTFEYNYKVPVATHFLDVPADAYYAQSVQWAVDQSITMGTDATTFSPDQPCTRAQILTFLWRASGSPEPTIDSPYHDIHAGYGANAYYYKAALWANEKGIFTGDTTKWGTVFGGDTPCTRRETVLYLWRAAGSPKGYSCSFSDISKSDNEAVQAVGWAVAKGITSGTGAATFSPDMTCTRGQIVTFLYRDLA